MIGSSKGGGERGRIQLVVIIGDSLSVVTLHLRGHSMWCV